MTDKVKTERLKEFVNAFMMVKAPIFGTGESEAVLSCMKPEAWELKAMAKELLAYRNSSHPLQQVLDKFEGKK